MRELTVLLLRALSATHFTSGVALAGRFGVSRSAVSVALKEANLLGIDVFSLTRKGYRLAAPLDLIEEDEVRKRLSRQSKTIVLEIPFSVPSTNTSLLARAAAGAPSGLVLATELQTAGRGRRGRVWHARLGDSLTFSLLWRFECGAAGLAGLSLVVGLAVVRALRALGLAGAEVKWPNDIWVRQEKLGGILIETNGDMLGPLAAVIGVGLNVRLPAALKDSLDQPATAVAAHLTTLPPRHHLLAALINEITAALKVFATSGFAPFRDEWRRCHALEGERVHVRETSGVGFEARVVDVNADGTLRVDRDGTLQTLHAADISLRGASSEK